MRELDLLITVTTFHEPKDLSNLAIQAFTTYGALQEHVYAPRPGKTLPWSKRRATTGRTTNALYRGVSDKGRWKPPGGGNTKVRHSVTVPSYRCCR